MVPKTPQQVQQQATSAMMRRLFRAPHPVRILVYILLGSLLIGFVSRGADLSVQTILVGLAGLAVPIVVSALITKPLAEAFGGKMYLRRSFLLGFLGMVPVFVVSLVGLALEPSRMASYLLVGWAATLWLRQATVLATSHSSPLRSFLAVVNQPLLGAVALIPFFSLTPQDWTVALVSFLAFYGAGLIFTEVAIRPLERASGVDGLSMLRYSLDHMTEKGKEGREEMESFFDSFASPMTVPVGVLSIRQDGGKRALLVVPSIHPGPYGRLGGSDLPEKLSRELEDMGVEVLVPHGPSTHDQNPASSRESSRVATLVREVLGGMRHSRRASRFLRVTKGKATVGCQMFGGNALLIASLAPNPTDDIDFATGFACRTVALEAGAQDAIFIDAHNCLQLGSGAVYFGSDEFYSILEATKEAVTKAKEKVSSDVRVGLGSHQGLVDAERGLGPKGVQALVVETDGQRTAYVLFDGNNMVPGLREEMLEILTGLVDEAEVLTSDNHIVNSTVPGYNPVGLRMDHGDLQEAAREAVADALEGLRNSSIGGKTGFLADVRVWGHQTAVRLTTAIQSSISTMRINAGLTFALATIVSILALELVP